MAGRTWLSQRVRDEAEARFVAVRGQAIADEVAGLIGDFQRLMDPGESDQEEAWDVLKRLHDIFADHPPKMPQPCTVMDGGEPDLQGRGTPPPAADEVPPPPDMGDETDDDGGDDDDDGAAAGDGDDDDRDDADGQDADQGGPSGTGAGDGPGSPQQSDLNKQLTDDADRQLNADETAKDLDDVMDALDHGRAGDADGDPSAGSNRDATDAARLLHREVSDALLDLKDEAEPGWVRRTDSGRLNPRRLLGSQINADELFDRYEPGQHDAADMEVAVLLDVSSSMASRKLALAESTWAIRQAVEDLEGTATVITWSYGHCTLAAAGDRPDGRMFVPEIVGGTNPTDALSDAFQILAGSDARIRLMVVLTDGDWEQSTKAEETIAAMREVGITTVLAFLPYQGATPKEPDAHGCEIAETIAQPQGLALLFRKVAAVRIQQW